MLSTNPYLENSAKEMYRELIQRIRNRHQILRFLIPILHFFIWGAALALFTNFEGKRGQNDRKNGKLFYISF